jgi:AcrR family transcriptional regulator
MPRQRRTREEKRQANRAQILVAARKVFARRGYDRASIAEIAAEAGLSNGAIYYNFKDKEDLFLALLDERIAERVRRLAAAATLAGEGGVHEEAQDVIVTLKQSREWRLLFLEFLVYAARNPSFRAKFVARRRRMRVALQDALEQRTRARGSAPPIPVEHLAVLVSGLVNGLAVEELSEPGSVPDDLLGAALTLLIERPPDGRG